jgi:hypothetical protein
MRWYRRLLVLSSGGSVKVWAAAVRAAGWQRSFLSLMLPNDQMGEGVDQALSLRIPFCVRRRRWIRTALLVEFQ